MVSVALVFKDVKEVRKRKKKESQAKKREKGRKKRKTFFVCLQRHVVRAQRIIRDCHSLPFAFYYLARFKSKIKNLKYFNKIDIPRYSVLYYKNHP
jgi:hypothetical protein